MLAGITLFCFVAGVHQKGEIHTYEGRVQLVQREATQVVTVEQAIQMQNQKGSIELPLVFTNWGIAGKTTLINKELEKEATVEVIPVIGNLRGLVPQSIQTVLLGENSCIIDKETAFRLFGTNGVVGNQIAYQGKIYKVSEVIGEITGVFIYTPEKKETVILNRVSLVGDGGEKKKAAEEFAYRFGTWSMIDDGLYEMIASFFLLLTPGFLVVVLLKLVWAYYREGKKLWKLQVLWGAVIVLIVTATIWQTSRIIQISPDMIPGKWSDFEFWGIWWKQQKEGIIHLISCQKSVWEVKQFLTFLKTCGWGVLAFLGMSITYKSYKRYQASFLGEDK